MDRLISYCRDHQRIPYHHGVSEQAVFSSELTNHLLVVVIVEVEANVGLAQVVHVACFTHRG